jgi:hypothetical protein
MRYPGDTNRMTVRFMREVYACIKECDPDAVMLGEGASLEGPVNIFSLRASPRRALDGFSPRDFFLDLNRYAPKRMVIDQGPALFPTSGVCCAAGGEQAESLNRRMTQLLKERGGKHAFTPVPGDLSVLDDLLIVPYSETNCDWTVTLPALWGRINMLIDEQEGTRLVAEKPGAFTHVLPGIYRMM